MKELCIDFNRRSKVAITGVSGSGKTIMLEKVALQLFDRKQPFVFFTQEGSYSWNNKPNSPFASRVPKSSFDFCEKIVNHSSPQSLFVEVNANNSKETICAVIKQIKEALKDGAYLLIDESQYMMFTNGELKALIEEAIENPSIGLAITFQCQNKNELEVLSKMDIVLSAKYHQIKDCA